MRTRRFVVLAISVLPYAAACNGDDDTTTDTGAQGMDAGRLDRGFPADTGVDAGVTGRDVVAFDVGHYCVENDVVRIAGQNVMIGSAESPALTGNLPASASCIDEREPLALDARITFLACLSFVGGSTRATAQELNDLEIAVFIASMGGDVTDPTYDPRNGMDRNPSRRVMADLIIRQNTPGCPNGVEAQIGRASNGANAVRTSVEYIIRTKSTQTSSMSVGRWLPTYHYGIIVHPDEVAGGAVGNCEPATCDAPVPLTAIRASEFTGFLGGAQIPGSADLADQSGSGYLLVETLDCKQLPMENAVVGVSPDPTRKGYLIGGAVDTTADETDRSGRFFALGFTGTSTSMAANVRTAVGIERYANTCTEGFAGGTIPVHPDAVSVFRSSRSTALHTRN